MSSPPRILHAYKSYYPDEGGIPTIIQLIAEGLTSSTHEVLCTHNKLVSKTDIINQTKVHRLASLGHLFSLPITPHYPLALWKLTHQFNILDYHFPMPWVDLAVASYLPRSTKLVVHWHSEIIAQKKLARLLAPMIHRCLRRADSIVVADKANMDHAASWLSAYQDKCKVIPYGIDIPQWQKISPGEEQKIQQLKKQYKPFVLAVGRLVPYKGFATLIDAMQFVDAELIIVGQGTLITDLQQLAAKRQLSHRVHFLGKTNQSDLKCLYHAAKLFALPSVTENEAFGMVQLEAMACGKPIVNTALKSGVPHVARHQQEALTVPPYSVERLADAINQILTTPELAEKLAANGLQRVANTYSLGKFLAGTLKLYNSLI